MTFGIEVECLALRTKLAAWKGTYGAPTPAAIADGIPENWKFHSDRSVSTDRPEYCGTEIVSPVLKGLAGLQQAIAVIKALKTAGCIVNNTCGFHVHVGWQNQPMKKLGDLIHQVANVEKAMYAATGTKRRENSTYCKPIGTAYKTLKFDAPSVREMGETRIMADRYFLLNLTCIAGTVSGKQRPTVEFRVFAGTMNPIKVQAYISMCLAVVHKAIEAKRRVNWEYEAVTNGSQRPDNGVEQMGRFFYQVGWTRGKFNKAWGTFLENGQTPAGLYKLQQIKKTLMEMAHKYDGTMLSDETA